ncbi:glycosyltransferase [Blautia sp. An249]|uniref:glycosyltransferase family 2 protein n=1 Tax=Blautia sp. An249 TaxID=1965603 RepID=UPI000B387DCF|nr:glycosyltransferase family 2 protein [Blautia sp. An249]OUO79852.1 glycosyltransferase [Blautia sp. An249]
MEQQVCEIRRERFHLLEPDVYLLQGTIPEGSEVTAYLDEVRIEADTEDWVAESALERFREDELLNGRKVTVSVRFPSNLEEYKELKVYVSDQEEKVLWFCIKVKELLKRKDRPQYYVDEEAIDLKNKTCRLRGWAASASHVSIKVFDEKKQPIDCEIQRNSRVDVVQVYKECQVEEKCGFYTEVKNIQGKMLYLVFWTPQGKAIHPIDLRRSVILKNQWAKYQRKGVDYWHRYGVRGLISRSYNKLKEIRNKPEEYGKWLKKHLPTQEELKKQRSTTFLKKPRISIVVPLYKTKKEYLEQLIASVQDQTYTNWELCLSDGSGADSPIADLLADYGAKDKRIKVISHREPQHISANTNAAIKAATGDFIAFADHDDVLTPNALYECVKAYNKNPKIQVFYSDEDKMTMDGNKFFQPHFKPDFNIDLLCTVNYICHLFVVNKEIIGKVGMLRQEFDGAQDYDFIFRCIEATREIYHIPKILYHWRCHEDSTAENPESKIYAFEAGQKAVQAHYDRIGVKAEVSKGEFLGLYRTRFLREYDPLISILIPNKDHIEDLKRCIDSLESKSTYKNYEYIIIENNSEEEETFAYYKELEAENEKVHVVYWDGPFNYSAINNFGETYAKGEYLLLLNNDTEFINEDCLEELLGYCMRRDVGAVGARLYYDDDTIQHAGVVLGFGGIAGHCFVQQPRGFTGYCHRIICAQDYSAVTAACMMVKREVFHEVGGFSEDLAVAFNDVDLCMKITAAGYLVVYNPYAELYHYESKSRGLEDTPEKIARFNKEIATLEKHWPRIFKDPDPYYNPNLTLESQDFSLKKL